MKRKSIILVGSLLVASPVYALLGLPSIVFDPAAIAKLVQQIAQYKQMYQQEVQLYTLSRTSYDTMVLNLKHFTAKNLWQTLRSSLTPTMAPDIYGNMANWNTALNTSPSMAQQGWKQATLGVQSTTQLSSAIPGRSPLLANLASVEATDGAAIPCISAISQYRVQTAANTQAVNNLAAAQLDNGANTNSEIQQLNLLNAGEAQKMQELKSQGAIETCIAEQGMIANMNQRNANAEALNFHADTAAVKAQPASSFGGIGNTIQTLRLP